jgi:hypothetical protein
MGSTGLGIALNVNPVGWIQADYYDAFVYYNYTTGSATVNINVMPVPVTIIPFDFSAIAHVGVLNGVVTNYAGPAWTGGLLGMPTIMPNASLGFYGGGSKEGMTGFNLNYNLQLAPDNPVASLYSGDNWIMTWVFKIPNNFANQWEPLPPTLFSIGDYLSGSEVGFATFPRRYIYTPDSYSIFPKVFSSALAFSGTGHSETNSGGYIWTLSNANIGVGCVAKSGNTIMTMIGSRAMGQFGIGGSITFGSGPTTGIPLRSTYLGAYFNPAVCAPWNDGIIWEFRMVPCITPPTIQMLSDLTWATLQF